MNIQIEKSRVTDKTALERVELQSSLSPKTESSKTKK